jgi:DNA-binding MarR family transcriptional regulator
MSKRANVSFETALMVRDTCVCLRAQQAARALARRFDEALRPLELTNGQFSLLMSLNRSEAPSVGSVAALLVMDRTTLTAALKPLERRRLVEPSIDEADKRSRRMALTAAGRTLLKRALPIWKRSQVQLEERLGRDEADKLRDNLRALAQPLTD